MTVILESAYSVPSGDQPLDHARIAHANNWLTGGTGTGSTTATDFSELAPLNTLTYEQWKPTAVPASWEYTHTGSSECDYCVIGGHDLGTQGCTIKVQYYSGSWLDACPATAVATDEPILVIFTPKTATQWRVYISSGSTPSIACVFFGTMMQLPQKMLGGHSPAIFNRAPTLRSNYSETGEVLGRAKQRGMLVASYEWAHLTDTWVRANWGSFQKAIESEPFFIAWRPADFGDVALAQVDEIPAPVYMGIRNLMSVGLTIRARGYD